MHLLMLSQAVGHLKPPQPPSACVSSTCLLPCFLLAAPCDVHALTYAVRLDHPRPSADAPAFVAHPSIQCGRLPLSRHLPARQGLQVGDADYLPDGMPADVLAVVPDDVSDGLPGDAPDVVPDDLPDAWSDDISVDMSVYLAQALINRGIMPPGPP